MQFIQCCCFIFQLFQNLFAGLIIVDFMGFSFHLFSLLPLFADQFHTDKKHQLSIFIIFEFEKFFRFPCLLIISVLLKYLVINSAFTLSQASIPSKSI